MASSTTKSKTGDTNAVVGSKSVNRRQTGAGKDTNTIGKNSTTTNSADYVLKDTDIFYRTFKVYPQFPDIQPEIVLSVTKPIDSQSPGSEKVSSSQGNNNTKERKKSAVDPRRGSTFPVGTGNNREGSPSPGPHTRDDASRSPSGLIPESSKKRTVVVWPEWNEADLNSEKWDVASTKGGKGEKEKGKPAATAQHLFEDPEGRCEIPPSLKVAVWKRPSEFLQEKTPVVVDTEGLNYFDLMSSNAVVHESQIMRWITSQISSLWHESEIKQDESATAPQTPDLNNVQESMYTHSWRPWEHIYAMTNPGKAAKSGTAGPNMPFYNPSGKYIVRLYWMGCWRKLVVDDTLPFDEDDHLLLPATTLPHELWPMLLTKALLKISALDNSAGGTENEFGDFSVIPCLTGWLPEVIPLQYGHMKQIWELLKTSLSEFKLPEPPPEPGQELTPEQLKEQQLLEEKAEKERLEKEGKGRESKDKKGKKSPPPKSKDKNKKDKSDKDDKQKSTLVDEAPKVPERPEIMVFAAYQGLPNDPVKMARLTDWVDVSEKLKQQLSGLSHCYAHPVLISQTRSCPLERPPAEEKIPAWKLIRPKKQALLSAETCGEMEKKIQSVHLLSPFVGYRTEEKEIDDQRPKTPIEISMIQSMDGGGDNADICQTDAPSSTQTESVLGNKSSLSTKQASKSTLQDNKTGSAKSTKSKVENEELTTPSKNGKKSVASKTPNEAKGKSSEAKSKNDDLSARKISETTEGGGLCPDTAECGDAATVKAKTVKDFWMDFDALCICFKSLYIYHKPNTYLCNQKLSDLKTPPPQASSKADKKATPAAVAAPAEEKSPQYLFVDNVKPTEIVVSFSALCQWNDPPSAVVPAPPPVAPKDDGGRGTAVPKGAKDAPVESTGTPADPQTQNMSKEPLQSGLVIAEPFSWKSLVTGQPVLRLRTTGNRAAVLSLPAGRHVLRFTMAAPLGYQIHLCSTVNFIFGDEEKIMPELTKESLRFKESAVNAIKALGICLQTFGSSDKHCPALKEFLSNHLMFGKNQSISIHQQAEIYKQALYTMLRKVLTNDVVLQTLLQQQVPPPSQQQQQQPGQAGQQQQQQQLQPLNCPEMCYAWRVFNFDCTTPNPLGLHHGSSSRPTTAITVSERASSGGKKPQPPRKTDSQKKGGASEHQIHQISQANIEDAVEREKLDYWRNKEITPYEHDAATKVQKLWKAYYVRKIASCRCMQLEASGENKTFLSIREQLLRAWSVIEMDVETNGMMFFKTMFNLCPELMASFPFYKDEWNKIVYTDYQGVYPDHFPNSWFLLFREIFYVTEDGLCIPRLTCPIPSSMIRVVNNDTKTELPRVFFKVAPHVFKKNKTGYTFLAEAWTGNSQSIVPAGKWKMRLIGSKEGLPTPGNSNEVNTSFNVQELREYYVPDKKVIFRYTITVKTDQLITLQMSTSKPDVYFKLSIYDNGKELSSTEGKGHAIIPAFIFRKDPSATEPQRLESPVGSKSRSRSNSATSVRSGAGRSDKKKGSSDGKTSSNPPSSRSLPESQHDLGPDYKDHKYTIEAVVLRDSWPLNGVQWMFVQSLKDNEKNQSSDEPTIIKSTVEVADNMSSMSVISKGSKTPLKSGKPALKEKEKSPGSSKFQAVQFDETKPNWTLRIVADGDVTDGMKVRRDTEKSDEIKAMKKAWEEAEPGRAAKAKQSRLQYLAKHLVKCENYEDISQTASTASVDVSMSTIMSSVSDTSSMYAIFGTEPAVGEKYFTSEPPPPKLPTKMVPPIDLTPFFRKTRDAPCLRDDAEVERELELKTIEMQEFRAHREKVEEWREKERLMRNAAKVQQLELCQQMQDGLNEARLYVNVPREAYRQKLLEVERKKMEEIAAAEAALQAELEKNAPQKGKKSPAKKKK